MTDLLSEIEAPSDAELISSVRGGEVAAYGELFSRHVDSANRLARQLMRGPDADDLVAEAFAKVLQVLRGGGGPDIAFRAYLLTAVRRLHVDRMRAGAKLQPSDDMSQFDPGIPFQDTAVAQFENGAAAKAFASLPERWQLVLWHLEVEGQKPADIAPLLGMSANSVSALAYRAREGLRQAFLTMHLADTPSEECRWVTEHLGAYVRNGLSRRDRVKVEDHLDGCRRCTAMYLELSEVNSNLAGILAPLLLGAAAAGYLSSSGMVAPGLFGLVGRVRDTIAANAGAATAGGVAAGVVAAATAGFLITHPGDREVVFQADRPITAPQPAFPSPSATPSGPTPSKGRSEAPGPAKQLPAQGAFALGADAPQRLLPTANTLGPGDIVLPDAPGHGLPDGTPPPTSPASPSDGSQPEPGTGGETPGSPPPTVDPDPDPPPPPKPTPTPTPTPLPTTTDLALSSSFTSYDKSHTATMRVTVEHALPGLLMLTLDAKGRTRFSGGGGACSAAGATALCPVTNSGTFSATLQVRIPRGLLNKAHLRVSTDDYSDPFAGNNNVLIVDGTR